MTSKVMVRMTDTKKEKRYVCVRTYALWTMQIPFPNKEEELRILGHPLLHEVHDISSAVLSVQLSRLKGPHLNLWFLMAFSIHSCLLGRCAL